MKLSVVMPTLNEEKAVGKVITDIKSVTLDHAEIIVVDSGTDRTTEIARSLGAKVMKVVPIGTGYSLRQGFKLAEGDVIITTDCDDTYPMEQIPDFIEKVRQGYDIVSGSRMIRRSQNMPLVNQFGNWLLAFLTRLLYRVKTTDITTGMRSYRKEVLGSTRWEANWSLPAEIVIRSVLKGYKYTEIPIAYRSRLGETKLRKFGIGKAYLRCLFKHRFEIPFHPYSL